MNAIVVGIGELDATNAQGGMLKTFALGSCIGVVMLAPCPSGIPLAQPPGAHFSGRGVRRGRDPGGKGVRPVAGLLHIALPDSSINPELARQQPGYFADTGIPLLLKKMTEYGCHYTDLIVKIAGGANIMDPDNTFNIGPRNVIAVKRHLWRYKLGAVSEDIGDSISRTMTVFADSGTIIITSPGNGEWEL
jgi:chemotaxis protein CheD